MRNAIKTKRHFPNEGAAKKLIYLALTNAVPAWTRTRNRTTALLAFKIHLGDRHPRVTSTDSEPAYTEKSDVIGTDGHDRGRRVRRGV